MNKRKIVLATTSKDKIREIKKALSVPRLQFLTLKDFPALKPAKENGKSFKENAAIKARHAAKHTGFASLADDSGICVCALHGAPGVHSSRWAGKNATDIDRNNKLLKKLKDVPWKKRKAYYECAIAIAVPAHNSRPILRMGAPPPLKKGEKKGFKIYTMEAKCHGVIAFVPAGEKGFGYDPLFYVPDYKRTMAQLPLNVKNKISHRGKALDKIRNKISAFLCP